MNGNICNAMSVLFLLKPFEKQNKPEVKGLMTRFWEVVAKQNICLDYYPEFQGLA